MTQSIMAPWQARAVDECSLLQEKIQKLASFIGAKEFKRLDPVEQIDLHLQLRYMRAYRDILDGRIERFK